MPNPYRGMKPPKQDFRYTPKSIKPSVTIVANIAQFDPKGVYPNLLGSVHPGPEGNHVPTLELIKAK